MLDRLQDKGPRGKGEIDNERSPASAQSFEVATGRDATADGGIDNGNIILAHSSFTRADGTTGDIATVNLLFKTEAMPGEDAGASTSIAADAAARDADVMAQLAAQSAQLASAIASFAVPDEVALAELTAAQSNQQIPLAANQG